MGAEIKPVTALPAARDQWSREDFAAAWAMLDNRVVWARAELAALFEGKHGDLRWLADRLGVRYSTLAGYRSVWNAYASISDVRNISFGAAEALMGQDDRKELVSRAEPWTVDGARQFAAERAQRALPSGKRGRGRPRKPPQAQPSLSSAGLSRAARPQPQPEAGPVTDIAIKPPAGPDPGHVCRYELVCRECGKPDRIFGGNIDKLEGDRERLRVQVAELAAEVTRLSEALSGAEQDDLAGYPGSARQGADRALDADGNAMPDYEADAAPDLDEDDPDAWLHDAAPASRRGRR